MSAGHLTRYSPTPGENELGGLLDDPRIKARLSQKLVINRSFDMPFLAGYSRNGRIIYIDRHLPATRLKIGAENVNVIPFLVVHESVEKALIDVFGYKYQPAHECATECENFMVRASGHDPRAYNNALRPYIKADELERVKLIPRDLDLTPYIDTDDTAALNRIRSVMNTADWLRAINGKQIEEPYQRALRAI